MAGKIFTFKNKRHMPKALAYLLAGLLKLYAWTLRVHFVDPNGVVKDLADRKGLVLAIWHNRILFSTPTIPRKVLRGCTVMISASRDGEYISTLVRCFGLESVRGSSSRGGTQALLGLEHALDQGYSPILTVDGPRGPKYTVHSGAVALARSHQAPLVPICINARRFWQLKSWDRMQIPKPFTRLDIVFGDALHVAPEESNEDANERLKNALLAITDDGDKNN